jgi:hypothetical protein
MEMGRKKMWRMLNGKREMGLERGLFIGEGKGEL